jgi:hypothetical protein
MQFYRPAFPLTCCRCCSCSRASEKDIMLWLSHSTPVMAAHYFRLAELQEPTGQHRGCPSAWA